VGPVVFFYIMLIPQVRCAYTTGTNLSFFVPTAGLSSLSRLFVKTSIWKQVLILHLPLIKTDNFECSHLIKYYRCYHNQILQAWCIPQSAQYISGLLLVQDCCIVAGCTRQGFPTGCSFLFAFRKLNSGKNCRCHVQSVP
jgi:hypothetical protein